MRRRRAVRRTSIVDSFHKPALSAQVLVHAVQRSLFFYGLTLFRSNPWPQRSYLNVPFFACPRGVGPPAPFRFPRTGECEDLPPNSFATQKHRLTLPGFDRSRKRRPVNAHRRCWLLL